MLAAPSPTPIKRISVDTVLCKSRFYPHWQAACAGELFGWRETPHGRLAEIILLDQFSRNLNRNSPRAWQQDGMALVLAQELVGSLCLMGQQPLHHGAAQLIIRDDQHIRADTGRAVQTQFFQLLGVRHLLHVNLNVELLFKVAHRIFDARRFLDVFPDVKLLCGMNLNGGERREDKSSENVLFHYQPHVKV
jgi:hypothetical protein